METLSANFLSSHLVLGYILTLFLLALEGQFVLFAAAFFTNQGIFKIYWILPIALLGVMGTDYIWYFVGRHLHGRSSFFRRMSEKLGAPLDIHLLQRPNRTLALAKFTFGLHTPVMLRAGSLKMSVKAFIKGDTISSLAWIAVVFSLGYGSSATLSLLKGYFRYSEIGLGIIMLVFILGTYFIGKRLKKEI